VEPQHQSGSGQNSFVKWKKIIVVAILNILTSSWALGSLIWYTSGKNNAVIQQLPGYKRRFLEVRLV
jgi:hypothetical protein